MNELQTINDQNVELIMAKQEIQILKLKNELEKVQAQKASRLEDSLFSPTLFPHYKTVAETLAKSGVIPNAYKNKPEDIFVAMAMGYQLGFPVEQALQDIAVINGRPCLWGDGLMALVLVHPQCEGVEEEPIYNGTVVTGYVCTVKRKGHKPHAKTFTIADATNAGLLSKGGVWKSYPERMLQLRARAYALRDKFADALRGIRQAEIEEDDAKIIDVEFSEEKETKELSQTEKLKNRLKLNAPVIENVKETKKETIEPEKVEPEDNTPITEENLLTIQCMMDEKKFDDVRKLKAMDYFKVTSLSQLTNAQAKILKVQLSKV